MTAATVLAGAAGGLAVAGAWEALAAAEGTRLVRSVARLAEPLRAARRAGREPAPAERRRLARLAAAVLLAGGWLVAGSAAGVVLAAAGPAAAGRLVAARRERWRGELVAAAPAAARALADALAGGHALRTAVGVAARDGGVPAAGRAALARAGGALAVGAPTTAVLEELRARARDGGWDAIVTAALLQRDAGGDLAALLRAIAARLEEAERLEADARTATAQARLTARLVLGLPLGAAVLGELAAPGSVSGALAEPLATACLAAALVLQALAMLAIRRLGRPLR